MKLSRKIISAVSAAAVFVSMAIPAFANNSYTTTVTYDIGTGKANFVTSGNATAGKEVTHIVYEKGAPVIDGTTIYYVDQTTADSSSGSFSFSYSVVSGKAAKTAVSVVGTDGDPITGGSTEVPGYTTINVTNNTGKDVTFTPNYTGAAPKTIGASETSGVVYVKPGDNVNVSVPDAAKFKYSINDGTEITTDANFATVTFASGNSSITISNVSETTDHNWDKWGTGETDSPKYDVIMTNKPASPLITDLTVEGTPTTTGGTGGTGINTDIYKKSVTYTANISTGTYNNIPSTYHPQYGIIFADSNVIDDVFDATTENAWILQALAVNSEGEWTICVMDGEDAAALNGCRARTYVKIGNNYAYGEIVSLAAPSEQSGGTTESTVMSPAPVAENIETESVEHEPADEQTTETDAAAESEEPGSDKTVNADGENTGSESILDTTDVEEKDGGETDTQTDSAASAGTETPNTEPDAE